MFRFSLTQLILLLVLVAILGGMLSAAFKSRYYLSYQGLAVSPDGMLAVAMTNRGFQLIDLHAGSSRFETLVNDWNPLPSISGSPTRRIIFRDNNSFAFTLPVGIQQSMAGIYSIPGSSLISEFVFQDATAINFLDSNEQTLLGKDFICRIPDKDISIPFFDLNESATIRHRFKPNVAPKALEPKDSDPNSTTPDQSSEQAAKLLKGRWAVSDDGSRLANTLDNEIKVFDSVSGSLLATLDLEGESIEQVFFLDQNRILLADRYGYSLFDFGKPEPSISWKIDLDKITQVNSKAAFSADKKKIAVSKRISNVKHQFLIIDSDTGKILFESPVSGARTIEHFVFDLENRLIVASDNSDSGITVWNTSTGNQSTLLGQSRWPIACLFTLLLCGWAWIWGRIARQAERGSVERNSERLADLLAEHPLDNSAAVSAKQKYSQGIVTDVELVETYDTVLGKKSLETAWCLMYVGGVLGIAWSVIPIFVLHGSWFFSAIFEQVFTARACLMIFGVIVGVMALARGTGKYHSLLRVTAGLQLFQMINFDVINFLLGAIETTMLNRDAALSEISNAQSLSRLNSGGDILPEVGDSSLPE